MSEPQDDSTQQQEQIEGGVETQVKQLSMNVLANFLIWNQEWKEEQKDKDTDPLATTTTSLYKDGSIYKSTKPLPTRFDNPGCIVF